MSVSRRSLSIGCLVLQKGFYLANHVPYVPWLSTVQRKWSNIGSHGVPGIWSGRYHWWNKGSWHRCSKIWSSPYDEVCWSSTQIEYPRELGNCCETHRVHGLHGSSSFLGLRSGAIGLRIQNFFSIWEKVWWVYWGCIDRKILMKYPEFLSLKPSIPRSNKESFQ